MSNTFERLEAALVDRYTMEHEIGAGGAATVYLAEDLKHHRKVAVKVLRPELAAAIGPERFLREIEIAANLTHPHILPLHDSGEADGFLYYVMPFVEGESLRDLITRERQLPVDQAIQIAREVADALASAHKRDVVHRDIKPENILLQEGHAVVADFGIARAISTSGGKQLTQTGLAMGTPVYMSPEQASADQVDGRSDIYALGCVLYEMLAGGPPFTASTPQGVMARHLIDPVPSLSTVRATVPPAVEAAITKALAKVPTDRFATAGEFAEALTRTDAVTPTTATSVGAQMPAELSIAVLPFANMSPDPENEYFSDGLTEEIIADLSKIRALSVISRTSAMQFKGTDKDLPTIGRELGVRYLLEGSVRRAGNSLRITAQLIDAQTDAHLWAEKYSGTMDDVFDVQERVSREIVGALDITLTPDEDRRLGDRPIADVRAFELYLRARQELRGWGPEAIDRASKLLSQAVEIEGETPPLRALMAWAKVTEIKSGLNRDLRPLDEAEAEAHALLALAPEAPYGHALLGYIEYERGHQPQAAKHFLSALDRDPNDADSLSFLIMVYISSGQNERGAEACKRLIACEPLAPMALGLASGTRYWFVGEPEKGLKGQLRALEIDPHNFIFHWTLGYTYASLSQLSEATKYVTWMRDVAPDLPYTRQMQALLDALNGEKERALECLAPVDAAPLDAHNKFHLAESFAMAGATDRALDVLERSVDEGFYPYPFIAEYCPFMAPLRGTPRFEAILAKAKRLVDDFE